MALDLSDDEELGEFIYRTNHTAKLLREKKEREDDEDMYKATDRSIENHLLPINMKKEEVKAEVKKDDDVSTDDERSPEYVISSSGCNPVKSEETDDEDCKDIDDTSSSHENIKVKEEYDVVNVKEEEEVTTDDEQYRPEFVVSSSSGYDPVKSEETDDEDFADEDTNTSRSNEQHLPTVDSTNVEYGSEMNETEQQQKSTQSLANDTTRPRASSVQESVDIQCITKKRKREVEGSNGSVQKAVRIDCSVEGCTGKAADSGTCFAKHKGYRYCNHAGCTSAVQGKGGVCVKHGASWTKKTCSHEGCDNQARGKRGVCSKHGAVVKTCSHEGCTKQSRKGGFCHKHREFAIGK